MKYLFSIFLFLMIGCTSSGEGEKSTEKLEDTSSKILGEWRNLSMIVRMPDSTVNVPEGQWESVLGIKPIRTTFNENGSFISEYRTLEDSVFMTSNGTWQIEGDTLAMIERDNENKYYLSIDGDTAIFRGYLDWDQDGLPDDHYAGKQIRFKASDENQTN